ncbi:hypothetical protein [Sphingobium sp. B2]|uniref:hypothetical protein n=1 Tax=Sphingobium sp. B2 TaxID=2583228 RepID=UPI0011A2D1B8|nr:hypothetical protein [Sphingobium sp. B2]
MAHGVGHALSLIHIDVYKRQRQRCQVALSTRVIAALRPSWACLLYTSMCIRDSGSAARWR